METKPLYNVGDTVTIAKRSGDEHDYRFSFIDSMDELAGMSFKITKIDIPRGDFKGKYKKDDDGWRYELDGAACIFSWASSMFVESSNAKDNGVLRLKIKTKSIKLNFNN